MTRILGISGSLRAGSFNTALLRAAQQVAGVGIDLEIATLHGIPLYDADAEARDGEPDAVAALKRKPGAFARWVLRDAVFPREVYRRTWERLSAQLAERDACKTMVGLLALAADGHEAQLADELEQLLEMGQLPDLHALTQLVAPRRGELPEVAVQLPALSGYDALLEGAR